MYVLPILDPLSQLFSLSSFGRKLTRDTQATKGLAAEYGPHQIRVNSICPLVTATGLFSAFTGMQDTPDNRAKFTSNVPMGRIGEVEDVVNACVFMASDEAKFITGVNLEVDGGRCI